MTFSLRTPRRAVALLGAFLVTMVALLLPAAPASAHAVLVTASPRLGTVVPSAPEQVVLQFNEPVEPITDKILVLGPDGKRADAGPATLDDATITIPLRPGGPNGTYLVSYRVVSADSHPIPGGYTFSVGAPSAHPPTLSDAATRVDPWAQTAMSVTKFISYAGLVVLVGAVLVLGLLWPARLSRAMPQRLAWTALGVVGASAVLGLLVQAPYGSGRALYDFSWSDLRLVLASDFGTGHLIRLGVCAAAAFLLPPVLAGKARRMDAIPLVLLSVVGLATWPISGHAGSSPVPQLSVVTDTFHIAGAAVWLGGLLMLLLFLLRRANAVELGAILPIWSRWATLAVAAIVVSGTVQVLVEVGGLDPLWRTRYGLLVLAKIGLLAVVLGSAVYARRLADQEDTAADPRRLRLIVLLESVIIVVVLAVSSVLVQTAPARNANAATTVTQGLSTSVTSPLYTLQVELTTTTVGSNELHLYAYAPDGSQQVVQEWTATASLPSAGVNGVSVPLVKLTPNHVSGQFVAPTAGQWQLRFSLRTTDIDEAAVTVTVPISP